MKYLTKSTSAFFIACCVAFLSGCGSSVTHEGTEIRYKADVIAPSALYTSNQTMAQPKEEVNPNIAKLAAVYDATHAKKSAPAARPAAPAAQPAPVEPPLASKENIEKAKARIQELRGTFKTAKNGAITAISVESADATLDDMKLFATLLDLESYTFLGSNFDDSYLAEFKDLKKITSVTVQNSNITGETLKMFATYPELKELDLRRNVQLVNNDLKAVADMPKLEKLAVYYNTFGAIGAKRIADSKTLKVVDMRACQEASDSAAKYLARMETLEEVYFRFLITDDGVDYLSEAPALKFVELQDCPITNATGQKFHNFKSLTGVRIFRSKAFDDGGVQQLAGLNLERLELRDLNVSNDGILALKDMTSLRSVELSELNSVDAAGLKTLFESWKDLTTLNLFSMATDDEVVKTICANMKGLKTLTLRASVGELSDASIDEILKLESLESLDIRENAGLTVDGMMKLAKMKSLRKIYIKGTALGDSADAVKAKVEEFKKINPKCAISN